VDLIVCVGDHCHLNGSEMVVRSMQSLLAESGLRDKVTLKGSFCCGKCTEEGGVTLSLGDHHFRTKYQDTETCFNEQIKPCLEKMLSDA